MDQYPRTYNYYYNEILFRGNTAKRLIFART